MKPVITHYAANYRCRNCGEAGRLADNKPEVIRKCSCGVKQKVELQAQYRNERVENGGSVSKTTAEYQSRKKRT